MALDPTDDFNAELGAQREAIVFPLGGKPRSAPPKSSAPAGKTLRFSDAGWDEAKIPKRPWLIPGYVLRGSVTLYAGVGSAGKSSLMCATAVAACLGASYGKLEPVKPLRVLIYNVEDDEEEQKRRLSAALRQFGKDPSAVAGRIMRVGPDDIGTLVEHDLLTGTFRMTAAWEELDALCLTWKPDIIMLDPLAELHTAEENNNTALRHVVALIRGLARKHDLGAILIHHFRKGGEAGDMDAVRGASAVVGAVRVALTVTPMTKEEAEEFGIAQDLRRRFFRVDNAKANYAPASQADWHELYGYPLANGEEIAAALPWTPKGGNRRKGSSLTPEALALVVTAIGRGISGAPYSNRLSDTEPRSITPLLARNNITDPKDQKEALRALQQLGIHAAEFRDTASRIKAGLRTKGRLPVADWLDAEPGENPGETPDE